MKKSLAIITLLALAPARACAEFGSGSAGTSAAEFLKFGPDARGAAMGEAMAAVAEDVSALYWNPAGLAAVDERQLNITGASVFQDVKHGFIGYAHPVRPLVPARRREMRPSGRGTLAAGLLYLNAGPIEEIDNTGTKTGGNFTPRDVAVLAGWGASITESIDLGIAIKYIDSRLHSAARTGSADLGIRYRTHIIDFPYTVALNARNLGGALTFRVQRDVLPLNYRIGQALRPFSYWVISSDLVFARERGFYPTLGSEFKLPLVYDVGIFLRGGWSGRTSAGDLDGLTGITLGGGVSFRKFNFDFAWVPFGTLGQMKRYSLSYRF